MPVGKERIRWDTMKFSGMARLNIEIKPDLCLRTMPGHLLSFKRDNIKNT